MEYSVEKDSKAVCRVNGKDSQDQLVMSVMSTPFLGLPSYNPTSPSL